MAQLLSNAPQRLHHHAYVVKDQEKNRQFFEDVLGFKPHMRKHNYAYMERDGCGIRIWGREEAANAPRGARNFRYYFDVRDVDGLYAELKPKLDKLPKGDVHGPADKLYGERELLVLAPDGDLVCFGQRI